MYKFQSVEGDEAKATHKKNLVKAKRIIADSIRIPHLPCVIIQDSEEAFDA